MARPVTRERQERFIRSHDSLSGREFDRALDRVVARHGGLSFFTDEQIAAITAEMVRKERWSHSLMIRNRRAYWAARAERRSQPSGLAMDFALANATTSHGLGM